MIRAAKTFIILAFLHHLVCTALYLIPLNPLSNYYLRYVATYMAPIFDQNWKLFAPEPSIQYHRLWYRCKNGPDWSMWNDPTESLVKQYQHNRLSTMGKLRYIQENISRMLIQDYRTVLKSLECLNQQEVFDADLCKQKMDKVQEVLQATPNFLNAVKYTATLCTLGGATGLSEVQFKVAVIPVTNYSERKNPVAVPKIQTVDFSPVVLKNEPR